MNRRHLLRFGAAGAWTLAGTLFADQYAQAQQPISNLLNIRYLGHTCFFLSGGGLRILTNPFKPGGCTQGYKAPKPDAELIAISSQLLDEGYVADIPGNPNLLYEPGVFDFKGTKFTGIRTLHDRVDGNRFGQNVVWKWNQAGIEVLHLGGATGTLPTDQRILLGKADVAIVPVGGNAKGFTADEAKQAIDLLQPRLVIPSHYRSAAAGEGCDLQTLDTFLSKVGGDVKTISGDTLSLRPDDLPTSGTAIRVLNYV